MITYRIVFAVPTCAHIRSTVPAGDVARLLFKEDESAQLAAESEANTMRLITSDHTMRLIQYIHDL